MVVGLFLSPTVARAAADEKTITGVISEVNPTTRIATVTPASGPPIVVQFAFNAGGPCSPVLARAGPAPRSPKPSPKVRRGRSSTHLDSGGCGHMVPRGTVNTVNRAMPVKAK